MSPGTHFYSYTIIAAIGVLALGFVCFAAGLRVNPPAAFRLACTGLSMSRWGRAPTLFFARQGWMFLMRPECADIFPLVLPWRLRLHDEARAGHGRRHGYFDG